MQLTIRTYDELDKYARAFAKGAYSLFFLMGSPGLSKSQLFRRMQRGTEHLWVEGSVTAFKLYMDLFINKDMPVVMDDVDQVYSDKALVRLLKQLCQTDTVKTVAWNSSSRILEAAEIPNQFETKSKVCIIANEWDNLSKHFGSLKDRGMMIYFRPPAEEIHRKACEFIKDTEVLEFIKAFLPCSEDRLSLRLYKTAQDCKGAGLDWKTPVVETLGLREVLAYRQVMEDKSLVLGTHREAAFQRLTGLSRPMFYNAQKAYKDVKEILPRFPQQKKKKTPKSPARNVAVAV